MKGRVILYGWVFSWILLFAGLGTMEWALETGDPVFLQGLALFMVFVVFSWLVIRHRKEVDNASYEFDQWFDRTFGNER